MEEWSCRMHNKFFLLLSLCFLVPNVFAKQKQCQPYLDKLRNIQAQQRQGHSNKKGRSLAEREQKARDKWWQCKRGKVTTKKKANTKKNTNKRANLKHSIAKLQFASSPKNFTNSIVIKAKYHGQTQQDWLDFYRRPTKCIRPKSTKIFAYCIEDEHKQQHRFDQSRKATSK